jgi:hypothetical protein
MVILAFAIGYIDDINSPKPYYYEDDIIMLNKKYQCPTHCGINHEHNAYFESEYGMTIDEDKLGEKVKKKKNNRKK